MDIEQLTELQSERLLKLTDDECDVALILEDYLDDLPPDFFSTHTLKELNEHFGGEGKMKITENLRLCLDACRQVNAEYDLMESIYDELPEDDEEE